MASVPVLEEDLVSVTSTPTSTDCAALAHRKSTIQTKLHRHLVAADAMMHDVEIGHLSPYSRAIRHALSALISLSTDLQPILRALAAHAVPETDLPILDDADNDFCDDVQHAISELRLTSCLRADYATAAPSTPCVAIKAEADVILKQSRLPGSPPVAPHDTGWILPPPGVSCPPEMPVSQLDVPLDSVIVHVAEPPTADPPQQDVSAVPVVLPGVPAPSLLRAAQHSVMAPKLSPPPGFSGSLPPVQLPALPWPSVSPVVSSNAFASGISSLSPSDPAHSLVKKLPIPKYDGNALDWPRFWSDFAPIHSHPTLDSVYKFRALLSVLTGRALTSMQTFGTSGYEEAIAHLIERYGDPKVRADACISAFMLLPAPSDDSLDALRDFAEKFSSYFKALQLYPGLIVGHSETMLFAKVFFLFPDSLQLSLSRFCNQDTLGRSKLALFDAWLRELIHTRVQMPQKPAAVASAVSPGKGQAPKAVPSATPTSVLIAPSPARSKFCVFCDSKDHYAA